MDIERSALLSALGLARLKAKRYADLGLNQTAQFHAEKATLFNTAVGSGSPGLAVEDEPVDDDLVFARATFAAGQHKRALLYLTNKKLAERDPRARILEAQCYFIMDDFETGLVSLGNDADTLNSRVTPTAFTGRSAPFSSNKIAKPKVVSSAEVDAALALLRAVAHEELGSMHKAVECCKDALRSDLHCYEAMQRLVDNGMALPRQLIDFVDQLQMDSAESRHLWIFRYYEALTESTRAGGSSASSLASSNTERIVTALDSLRVDWCMAASVDVLELQARVFYADRDYGNTSIVAELALEQDPLNPQILLLYLSSLFELGKKQRLFSMGHDLVRQQPENAISWLAVGYYYLLCSKFDAARRYLQKATTLNGRLAAAWLAYGHTFAAQDESDQSMAAYRTASRLFPGSHLPLVYIGAEYARQSSFVHADRFFRHACEMAPRDPIPLHELGVVAYRSGEFPRAVELFESALKLCKPLRPDESTMFNLGHAYRRLGQLESAQKCYEKCLSIRPRQPSTHTSLGMVQHMLGLLDEAAATYHTALRLAPDDTITQSLLEQCLLEMMPLRGRGSV